MTYKEYNENKIQNFEYETTINSDGNILGTCELGKATMQLLNDDNQYSSFKDSWIKTVHGSFYVYDVKPVQEKINIKLECYDIKYKLDKPYDASKHSFPCTLKEWRNSIFDDCDVEYDNSDFPNSDMILYKEPYIGENPSNRNVIALIAKAGTSFVITNENDKFFFAWFNNTIHIVKDWVELTTEKEKSNSVNCVIIGRGDVGDNVFYPNPKPNNPVEFRIDNDYILDPQSVDSDTDDRYENIKSLYERLNGFSYLVFNMRTQQIRDKLSIELGETVKYKDIWDNTLTAYIMSKKIVYLGGDLNDDENYEIILSADKIKETSTDLSYATNIQQDILEVSRKADKLNGIIEDTVKKVEVAESSIEKFRVNLESNNIVVSVDNSNKPHETTNYDINYDVFFMGKKIACKPITEDEKIGITLTIDEDYIRFAVDKDVSIFALDNKYTFKFSYTDSNNNTYELYKTIMLSLVLQGQDGKDSAIQSDVEPEDKTLMWLDTTMNQLKRYNGETWEVVNDFSHEIDSINSSINDLDASIQDKLHNLENEVNRVITEFETKYTQTNNAFAWEINETLKTIKDKTGELEEKVIEQSEYMKFEAGVGLVIGKSTSPYTLVSKDDGIEIRYNNVPISFWNGDTFKVTRLMLGNFAFTPRDNGSLDFGKVVN